MNRKDFLKRLALGTAGAVVAPQVISEVVKRPAMPSLIIPRVYKFPVHALEGQLCYMPNGYLYFFKGGKWLAIAGYDVLDGQHGHYQEWMHMFTED